MCGINGIISFGEQVDKKNIQKMNDCLKHRGPDGEGIWLSPNKKIALGHRRLSIIDLSNRGAQPMSDAGKNVWITFNGEIYNYIELKDELLKDGIKFSSDTDTEVIIHLYKKYGEKCLDKLRGMFAFCIVDLEKHKAFLARDRIGKKPLIYCFNNKTKSFFFSSEIRPVVEVNGLKHEIDLDGLNHFFTHVYFHVPAPYTIFKNVKKLEPASFMLIDLKTGKSSLNRYWKPDFSEELTESFDELKNKYLTLTQESVKIRERSDVPVGILLSGGLDSSTVLALMSNKNIHTFAIGYDKDDPELQRARIVSQKFGTKHHEFTFEGTGFSYLGDLIDKAGEPFNVPSALYAMQLSEKIKNAGIKVVMNGTGADEYFCGYSHHNILLLLTKLMKLKKIFGTKLFKFFDVTEPKSTISKFIRFMSIPDEKTKGELYRIEQKKLSERLYSDNFKQGITEFDAGKVIDDTFNLTVTNDTFKKHFYCDLSLANAHSMTYTSDITGMAHSLEIRSPFLDHELIEFGGRVPNKFKIRSYFSRTQNKYIMKKVAESFLPKDIVYASKMGFGYNIKIYKLFRNELKNEVNKRLFRGNLEKCGLFNMDYVKKIVQEHIDGTASHGETIMALICFDEWFERYMK